MSTLTHDRDSWTRIQDELPAKDFFALWYNPSKHVHRLSYFIGVMYDNEAVHPENPTGLALPSYPVQLFTHWRRFPAPPKAS